jgi:hypothetical protein
VALVAACGGGALCAEGRRLIALLGRCLTTRAQKKFLVPNDISVGKFIFEIRKHMQLAPEQAIFLFVNEALPPSASLVSQIYKQHADEDGFLYVTYSGENSFGE